MGGKAIIFSAPSGSGKTTIVHHLLGVPDLNLAFSVSATSRPKRGAEADGRDYFFITPEEFIDRARKGDFIEWEEVYKDQYYGTLKSEIDRLWSEGKNVIFDVDVVGGLNLKKYFGEQSLALFVQPPSIETLRFRLRNRSTETDEKIAMRIDKAQKEMAYAPKFDAVIVNDILEDALIQAESKVREFLQS
ncbi:MAG: guanylate kinase [Flavobacteriales bacterium]|nr:guanylate kinase [Flavobacteriales bacterium]